jgi:parallel beta-helix repeat protein
MFIGLIGALACTALSVGQASAAPRVFYVDCAAGNDAAAGSSPSTAWKSVARANKATLSAGDSLLFKRGCTWSGTALAATWAGTSATPVTIATYGGSTAAARIANASIKVTGQYQIIDGFLVTFKPVATAPCGQPLGQYYALVITQGGAHNTIRNNTLTQATAGIHISKTSGGFNTITGNTISGNNVMQTPFDGKGDLGAWGILVRGSDNDISYNTFRDNKAVCKPGTYVSSNSVEIYEGDRNRIHHNRSYNDRVFSELGSSATNKAEDNSYAFNLHTSSTPGARFITTRGGKDATYGPVRRTTADRNTINYTGAGSQGIVCSLGCTGDILTARYNIINVVEKTIYYDGSMGQAANVLWANGAPVKIEDGAKNMRTVAAGSYPSFVVGDPGFVNPANENLRLRVGSIAINIGGKTAYTTDLEGNTATNGPADVGAYEFVG